MDKLKKRKKKKKLRKEKIGFIINEQEALYGGSFINLFIKNIFIEHLATCYTFSSLESVNETDKYTCFHDYCHLLYVSCQ